MSKEQTPINIQSELTRLYGLYGWSEMFLYKAQLLFDRELHKKVSEAIQKEEVIRAYMNWYEGVDDMAGEKYYETQVKPKYE
jgi:hypothetical protein